MELDVLFDILDHQSIDSSLHEQKTKTRLGLVDEVVPESCRFIPVYTQDPDCCPYRNWILSKTQLVGLIGLLVHVKAVQHFSLYAAGVEAKVLIEMIRAIQDLSVIVHPAG